MCWIQLLLIGLGIIFLALGVVLIIKKFSDDSKEKVRFLGVEAESSNKVIILLIGLALLITGSKAKCEDPEIRSRLLHSNSRDSVLVPTSKGFIYVQLPFGHHKSRIVTLDSNKPYSVNDIDEGLLIRVRKIKLVNGVPAAEFAINKIDYSDSTLIYRYYLEREKVPLPQPFCHNLELLPVEINEQSQKITAVIYGFCTIEADAAAPKKSSPDYWIVVLGLIIIAIIGLVVFRLINYLRRLNRK